MASPEMPERSREILDDTIAALRGSRMSGTSQLIVRTVLRSLKRRREYDAVITQLLILRRELAEIGRVLGDCADRLLEAERAEAKRTPGGSVWANQLRREVAVAVATDASDLTAVLARAWLEALRWGELDLAVDLCRGESLPAKARDTADDLGAVAQALRSSRPVDALDPLERLVERADGGLEVAAPLGLLRVRLLLEEFSNRQTLREFSTGLRRRTASGEWEHYGLAALAEDQLANEGPEEALATLVQATRSRGADAWVLRGEACERLGRWAEADEAYDEALEADERAIEAVLHRRVPARLLLRAAARTRGRPAEAVVLLRRAIGVGVAGDGDHPDKDVWVWLGDALLEQAATEGPENASVIREQAAEAYFEGALRYSWSGLIPPAVELLERSCGLAPGVAEYWWHRAESLRLSAYLPDEVVDHERLMLARESLRTGLELRNPGRREAWMLLTMSKIDEDLEDPSSDPCLPLERALLLDPDSAQAYWFLASALRRQGWPGEALTTMRACPSDRFTDLFPVEELLMLHLDHDDYSEAWRLLDSLDTYGFDEDTLMILRAHVHLRAGEAERVVELLADSPSDLGRLVHALALAFLGCDDEASAARAREEYRALWLDTRTTSDPICGWAAFGAGRVDEAIATYGDLAARAPGHVHYRRDLGQMLLVRGEVAQGVSHVLEGIDSCPFASDLGLLTRVEFPIVRSAVSELPHRAEVEDALAELARRAEERVSLLRQRRRPGETLSAEAARARGAIRSGDLDEALARYRELAHRDVLPEATLGLLRAGAAALAAADELFRLNDGTLDHRGERAKERWAALAKVVEGLPGCEELTESLRARRLLSDLMVEDRGGVESWLSTAKDLEAPDTQRALREAVDVLVTDPSCLWALRDGLLRVAEGAAPPLRSLAGALLTGLPVSRIYGLGAEEAVTYPSFLAVRQLEMRLAPDVAEHVADDVDDAVHELRNRLESEVGVQIPWVYHRVDDSLTRGEVAYEVYGRWVGSTTVRGAPERWQDHVAQGLDRSVRAHLFRLVGIDDVALWLRGWHQLEDRSGWRPADPIVDRLRLARVLRMLLREGASVTDREAILGGLDDAGKAGGPGGSALETLRVVRRRLTLRALGVGTEPAVALPAELERRLLHPLSDERPVWELERRDAHRLVAELHAWLDAQKPAPAAISVESPRLRPFVWRLVADRGTVVVSREELDDE